MFNDIPLYLAQWVDMDFFCTKDMFEALDYKIEEQNPARWMHRPTASSGVGRNISLRLAKEHLHLYLTTETLVIHDHHESKMNPLERDKNPLITKPITNPSYGMPNG
jgi:hypothetical protein